MAIPVLAFQALDLLSAALLAVLVAFFARSWRRSGEPLHLLFAVGFGLIAAGVASVSTSAFDLARPVDAWDALRFAGYSGGAFVLFFAYLSRRRHGVARPARALAWSAAAGALMVVALYFLLPPEAQLPVLADVFALAHAAQLLAFLGCATLALPAFLRAPRLDHALVPAAFLLFALSKYTWLLIDVTGVLQVVPIVFLWRFLGVGLLLLAVGLPSPRRRWVPATA